MTSPREETARRLASVCIDLNLTDAYGVDCQRATDKRGRQYWSVLFCKARVLDGVIRVYGHNWIQITTQHSRESIVLKSFDEAKAHLETMYS